MNTRINRLRQESFEAEPSISIERALIETEFYRENYGKYSLPVLRALVFKELCARKIITDGVMESLTITARVRGHVTDNGKPWTPGMHIRLRTDAFQCDITTLLTKRTFVGGRSDGTITDLTLKPWGVWLPDTAKKPRKKKKKSDGDECDCDID